MSYLFANQIPFYYAQPQPCALPPINGSCWSSPLVIPGYTRYIHYQHPTQVRDINLHDSDLRVVVRENNHHTTFHKTIVTQLNRHHLHTQRVITNENNFNHYVTNNVIRVNDIHRQRVEHVPGQRRVFNDYKQTQVVEPSRCLRTANGAPCGSF